MDVRDIHVRHRIVHHDDCVDRIELLPEMFNGIDDQGVNQKHSSAESSTMYRISESRSWTFIVCNWALIYGTAIYAS